MLTRRWFFKTKMFGRDYSNGGVDVSNFIKKSRKVLGAVENYVEIIEAKKKSIPKIPVLFEKPTSTLIGEGNNVILPKVFSQVEYEVELGIIIQKKGKNISLGDAMGHVGGYCIALDLSAQDELSVARRQGLPWLLGKGFDTATPVSSLIPKSQIKDPHVLDIWLKVNGQIRQQSNTKSLIFQVPDLIEYTSKYMTLEPYDLIMSGTPTGAKKLNGGDVIEAGIGNKTVKFYVVNE